MAASVGLTRAGEGFPVIGGCLAGLPCAAFMSDPCSASRSRHVQQCATGNVAAAMPACRPSWGGGGAKDPVPVGGCGRRWARRNRIRSGDQTRKGTAMRRWVGHSIAPRGTRADSHAIDSGIAPPAFWGVEHAARMADGCSHPVVLLGGCLGVARCVPNALPRMCIVVVVSWFGPPERRRGLGEDLARGIVLRHAEDASSDAAVEHGSGDWLNVRRFEGAIGCG